MRSLAQYRQYVYDYLDLDIEDVAESLIDQWVKDGFGRIIRTIRRWPFYEMERTLTTSPGQRAYDLPGGIVDVSAVESNWGVLMPTHQEEARQDYHLFSGNVTTGHPRSWTIFAGQLQVWPLPDSSYELTITGYRKATDWMAAGAGAEPDFPEEFEDALLHYVMYRAHEHQDDTELAERAKRDFEETLNDAIAWETQVPSATPLIMGGGARLRPRGLPHRQPYPWE